MSTQPVFRDSLLAARQRLSEGREAIRQDHRQGSPGIQISARLTELLDMVVLDLYRSAIDDLWPGAQEQNESQVALVAHGGFGRRDVAPYSDVDLMILHAPGTEEFVFPLAARLLRDLSDARFDVGQSVRTPGQACKLAAQDATICTSLMESRLLVGSEKLFAAFFEKFQRRTCARGGALFQAIEDARRKERSQFGDTVYLLEPNIKRSRGGLRDVQLLRWLGFILHGSTSPDALQLKGAISKSDQRTLRAATEFLLRLRNEMHFHAEKSNDVLDRSEQLRLAPVYGFQGTEGILPVEQFMREYFHHTNGVRSVVGNFVASSRPGEFWNRALGVVFSHQVDGDYRVTPRQIVANKRVLPRLKTDLVEVLRLCELANLHNKRIAPATWETVRAAVPGLNSDLSPEVAKRFLSLISQPGRLGELLRRLHELGVLEKIVPGFTHARCLLQFNEYHKYTVDEHCILAVQRASEFITDQGLLGRVYAGIKQKRTLHLALLIHDLGKGFVEDHSEVGLRIAEETAHRLRLPLRETETLKFLVHKHLAMSHLAFWRDSTDPEVIIKFAIEVGSPEVLDMLYVLTAADFAAVGPGVWNSWKAEVLSDLYRRTMRHLAGDAPSTDTAEQLERQREKVRACLGAQAEERWFARQLEALPPAYAFNSRAERIADELRDLCTLGTDDVHARGRYLNESHTLEFVVGTQEGVAPGIFHKLCGALASQGLQILSAEINTLADGLVLDRFYVADPDYVDQPPPERIDRTCEALVASLRSPAGATPTYRQVWRSDANRDRQAMTCPPTQVRIDNSTSDRFTIIDVFTRDRLGLLFAITRKLFELDLSVSVAKIGTHLDQVVDVFYVTTQSGYKIVDEQRLQQIVSGLLEAIDGLVEA